MSLGGRSSPFFLGTQMRASLRRDSLISIRLDCHGELIGRGVGWNWMKHGEAKYAPRRCARNAAVALEFIALVDLPYTLAYPPVASTTAWAVYGRIWPLTMSRATMPWATPSLTIRSSISCRVCSRTVPFAIWRHNACDAAIS